MSHEGLIDTWVCAADLADPGRRELSGLVDAARALWGGAPAVAAAQLWKQYAWYVVETALQGWASGVVPDLGLDAVEVRFQATRPHVAVRAHRKTVLPVRSDAELARWFSTEVVKGHLTPVLEALHDLTRAGRRLLWGSVAHAVALPQPTLLERLGPPLHALVDLDAGQAGQAGKVVRRTCCLAFRTEEPVICDYCPIKRADCAPLARQVF